MAEKIVDIPAGAWDYDPTNYPEWEKDVGTNGEMVRDRFDDSTEEYAIAQIQAPGDLDTGGTVYLELYGYAVTADGNEVRFRFSHSARAVGENWDNAYANVQSADYATDGNQDELDFIEWNATVASLGWTADDHIRIMLSRSAIADGTPVSGDYAVTHFRIRIPIV